MFSAVMDITRRLAAKVDQDRRTLSTIAISASGQRARTAAGGVPSQTTSSPSASAAGPRVIARGERNAVQCDNTNAHFLNQLSSQVRIVSCQMMLFLAFKIQ